MNLALQLHYNQMKTFDDILGIKKNKHLSDDFLDAMRYQLQNTPKWILPRGTNISELHTSSGIIRYNGSVPPKLCKPPQGIYDEL